MFVYLLPAGGSRTAVVVVVHPRTAQLVMEPSLTSCRLLNIATLNKAILTTIKLILEGVMNIIIMC